MALLTSTNRRSSSSSYRYSSSSSYRTEGSLGGSPDSLDPLFETYLDSADHSGLFGDVGPAAPKCLAPHSRHRRSSFGSSTPIGGAVTGRQSSSGGGVRCVGDVYYMSADVSQFEPHDVVVMAFNHQVVIHAAKVMDDGTVGDTFTHKSLFPDDMDPLSVCGTFSPDGVLVVSVHRTTALGEPETLAAPVYRSEAHL